MDNITAKVSCFARAYHCRNNTEWIFRDEAAEGILGQEDYSAIAQSMTAGISFFAPQFSGTPDEALRFIADKRLSPSVLARSAFCERHLENELRLGCSQYAIFASGYDTFALRKRFTGLRVFELDKPEMLEDKLRRIESFGLELSCETEFIGCELAAPQWADALEKSGFKPEAKSFGSLLGISYYLDAQAFDALLGGIARLWSKGSAICLDYPSPKGGEASSQTRALAAGANEQMQAQYEYSEMEQLLSRNGFLIYEHLDHRQMTEAFFAKYNAANPGRRMEAPEGVCYLLAVKE